MKKLVGLLCAIAVGVFAAERTPDGYGLVEAFSGTTDGADAFPFRYLASAVSGGTSGSTSTHVINRDNSNAWAPERIYQLERYNVTTTTFTGLVPNAAYKVELHASECYFGGSNGGDGTGRRIFNVLINNVQVETGIDIYVQAGGAYKALVKQYECTADANGKIAVKLTNTKDNARFGGIAVFGQVAPSKPSLSGFAAANDLMLTIGDVRDVHRFYVERSTVGASGPWSGVASPLVAETREATLANVHDSTQECWYRVVASNGVGVAASDILHMAPAEATDVLATTGSVVADDPSAVYAITSVGDAAAGANTLAADDVRAAGYMLEADGDSTLSLGAGQTFEVGILGVGEGIARTLSIAGEGTLAAKDGTLTTSVKNEGANLLVTAAAAGGGAGKIVKSGPGAATFAGGISGFATYTINDGEFVCSNNVDATASATLVGSGDFVKAGSGVLTITNAASSANADFSGDVVVRESTLRFGKTGTSFANAAGVIRIEDGAALDVAAPGLKNESVNLGSRKVVVQGAGPDGRGAIVNGGGVSQYNALKNGELAGDAVFGGGGATLSETVGRWDFRSGALNMNGHSIRKVGKNMVCLTGVALTGDTGVTIDVDEGYWSSETSTSYSGGSENAFNIAGGAYLDFYQISNPLTWTLNLADGAVVQVRSGSSGQNRFTGPVNITAGTATLLAKADAYATLEGVISGEGGFKCTSAGGGRVTLANPANTYQGATTIAGGDLEAKFKGSLPGYNDPAKVIVTNATLIIPLADGEGNNWGAADVRALVSSGQLKASNAYVGLEIAEDASFDGAFTIPCGGLSKYGAGTLSFADPLDIQNGGFNNFAGTTIFTNDVQLKGGLGMRTGEAIFRGGATLRTDVTKGTVTVGSLNRTTAKLTVDDATLTTMTEVPNNTSTTGICIGQGSGNEWDQNGARGILEVSDGAVISNKYVVGQGLRAQGALYQDGGRIVNCGGQGNDIVVGNYGYGYVEINGGYHEWMGYGQVCGSGVNASGVFVQHGGEFEFNQAHVGRMAINRSKNGGRGEIYLDGGVFNLKSNIQVGEWDNRSGGTSCFTIDGEAQATVRDYVNMANRNKHTAVLNLNGGVLSTQYVTGRLNVTNNNEDAVSLVNFNGGTLKCRANGEIFKSAAANRPNAVTVYAGGATIDTAGYSATIAVPLEKPRGKGIASIAIPAGTDYIGSPVFKIDGDGVGATAHAVYDRATKRVTEVKITSPGVGYTTATVTSTDGGWTNIYSSAVTLADNAATGGLTKKGGGSLTLSAANTFGGAVTVAGGTLIVTRPDAFPEGNDLVLDGGTIAGDGCTITAGVVRVTSGSFVDVTVVCDSFEKTGDGVLTFGGAEIKSKTGMTLAGGKVLLNCVPGLHEGRLSGAQNWNDPNPSTGISLGLSMAQVASTSTYGDNVTYVYSGYIWNRADAERTWTFAGNFDDYVLIRLDGEVVLEQTYCWTGAKTSVTVAPGAHRFEVRVSNGTGNGGAIHGQNFNTSSFGVGIDFEGRDEWTGANYVKPVDPGDGSLFTTSARFDDVLTFEDVTTAALEVNGSIALKGEWSIDAATLAAGGFIDVAGTLDFSQVDALTILDGAEFGKNSVTIARATGGFTGDPKILFATLSGVVGHNWSLCIVGNELRLVYSVGTMLIIK